MFTMQMKINNEAPLLMTNTERTLNADQELLKRTFPVSVKPWYNELPPKVRALLGTKKFDIEVLKIINGICRHPVDKKMKNCSYCHDYIDISKTDMNQIIDNIEDFYETKYISFTDYQNCHNLPNNNLVLDAMLIKMFNDEDIVIHNENWTKLYKEILNNPD